MSEEEDKDKNLDKTKDEKQLQKLKYDLYTKGGLFLAYWLYSERGYLKKLYKKSVKYYNSWYDYCWGEPEKTRFLHHEKNHTHVPIEIFRYIIDKALESPPNELGYKTNILGLMLINKKCRDYIYNNYVLPQNQGIIFDTSFFSDHLVEYTYDYNQKCYKVIIIKGDRSSKNVDFVEALLQASAFRLNGVDLRTNEQKKVKIDSFFDFNQDKSITKSEILIKKKNVFFNYF